MLLKTVVFKSCIDTVGNIELYFYWEFCIVLYIVVIDLLNRLISIWVFFSIKLKINVWAYLHILIVKKKLDKFR